MSWRRYDLIYRLHSPLHIGYRRVGNLMQTRGYAPGRNLWAFLTARLTRDYAQDTSAYEAVGQEIMQYFRFTYLHPALPHQSDQVAPSSLEELKIYYAWSDSLFEYLFLDSYASTALDYAHRSAEDGALHEVTFLRPRTRPLPGMESMPVYLAGHIYVRQEWPDDSPLQWWREALKNIQIGGERTYGWGRMVRTSNLQEGREQAPEIELKAGAHAPAHSLAVSHGQRSPVKAMRGTIEPLVGWERDNTPARRRWRLTPHPAICYAPGSRVMQEQKLQIGPMGILSSV